MIIPAKSVCIAFVSWASAACRRFGPTLDDIAGRHPGVAFAALDIESEEPAKLALEQGVTADTQLPMFKRFKAR